MTSAKSFSRIGDVLALTKPGIMVFSLITAFAGFWLAPTDVSVLGSLYMLMGTGLIVGAANTLNMYAERQLDGLMARTRNRPLPAQRLAPRVARLFGWSQAMVAIPILAFGGNALTAALGAIAFFSYVFVYTPLKRYSSIAVWVGAVPGAMPILLGWTFATGSLDAGGAALFAILFLWQMPHFYAISMYRSKEYQRAGLKVLPNTLGMEFTKRTIALLVVVQVLATVAPVTLDIAGGAYLVCAAVLGVLYVGYGLLGLTKRAGVRWARKVFVASIVYLPMLLGSLLLDAL